ncbi:unnamed protein product [Blepharisma stoltei]|uniref:Uncharacterized protein n=1 Tax=Blepharisma stoltei TaxID=1481888 RepID=A0AAU9K103_9CILI|nr:unnamed protein product [Blepharisma stoltei]
MKQTLSPITNEWNSTTPSLHSKDSLSSFDSLNYDIIKREEILARLKTESKMLESDFISTKNSKVIEMETEAAKLQEKLEQELDEMETLNNILNRTRSNMDAMKVFVEKFQIKEKMISSRVKDTENIVAEALASSRDVKNELKFLNRYVDSLKTATSQKKLRTQYNENQNSNSSEKSESEGDSKEDEMEMLKAISNKLTTVEKITSLRVKDVEENKVKSDTLDQLIGTESIESWIKEIERIQIIEESLSRSIQVLMGDLRKLESEKLNLEVELSNLKQIQDLPKSKGKYTKEKDRKHEKYKEAKRAMKESKGKWTSMYTSAMKIYDLINLLLANLDEQDEEVIEKDKWIANKEPTSQQEMKEFEIATLKILEQCKNKLDSMEISIVDSIQRKRTTRPWADRSLTIIDGRPFKKEIYTSRMYETMTTDTEAKDPERKIMAKLSASINNNDFFHGTNDGKKSRGDAFSLKQEHNLLVPAVKSPKSELDELTGINNFDKKLQKLSALTHQKHKSTNLNGQSLKILSLDLERKMSRIENIKTKSLSIGKETQNLYLKKSLEKISFPAISRNSKTQRNDSKYKKLS